MLKVLAQGDKYGLRHSFVDFDLNDPMSAWFCLGSSKSGRTGMTNGQHGGIPKSKSTKYCLKPELSLLAMKSSQNC